MAIVDTVESTRATVAAASARAGFSGGSMSLLTGLLSIFTSATADKALDIALEKTEDVDKRNALLLEYYRIKEATRTAEVNRVTVPWVDALHKMGRQIFWLVMGTGVIVLVAMGKGAELRQQADLLLAVLSGGGAYTLMKGRGR